MSRKRVYLETTIVSYLAARRTRDLVVAARQELTSEWWETRRNKFDVFISQLVLDEAREGDKWAAERRLKLLDSLAILDVTDAAVELANRLLEPAGILPVKATDDALHLSLASVHRMDFLLTWNCKHLANAELAYTLAEVVRDRGYAPPIICTPEELMGE